jgi:hypothetical protein
MRTPIPSLDLSSRSCITLQHSFGEATLSNVLAIPFAQSLSEADIDWILCLELNGNESFRSWLGALVFGSAPISHLGAWRSFADSAFGESDIVWLVAAADGSRQMALIENKIDAPAQPKQFERYLLRAAQYCEQGHCSACRVVLISPDAYRSTDSGQYQVRISYESIRAYLHSQGDERGRYLSSLFERALHEPRPEPSPEITAFRRSVYELACTEFPQLELDEPLPTREYWVAKNYGGVAIKYKMYATLGTFTESVVDLEIPGAAGEVEQLREAHAEDLESLGAAVVRAGKSAAIRVKVPCAKPPAFDASITRPALEAWATLLAWWKRRSAEGR